MANDQEVRKWFSHGLHERNYDEVKQVATNILTNMDNPKNYGVRWTVHNFDKPFRFVMLKGFFEQIKSPEIESAKDKNYPFYLTLFAVLSQKGVNCHGIDVLYKHADAHGFRGLKDIGKKIASTIR